jgi:Spy/CpxP family protein refolding chaperone
MKIKTFSLVAALAVGSLLACTALAQDTPTPKQGKKGRMTVEQQLQRMTTELNLTDAQKPKVEAVLKDTDKKRTEIFGPDSTVPQDQRREKARALLDDQDKELKKVLTPEQYTKWEKLREEMRQRRGGGPGGPGGGGGEKKGGETKSQ